MVTDYTKLAEKARSVSGIVNAFKTLEECADAIDELVRENYELHEALKESKPPF